MLLRCFPAQHGCTECLFRQQEYFRFFLFFARFCVNSSTCRVCRQPRHAQCPRDHFRYFPHSDFWHEQALGPYTHALMQRIGERHEWAGVSECSSWVSSYCIVEVLIITIHYVSWSLWVSTCSRFDGVVKPEITLSICFLSAADINTK